MAVSASSTVLITGESGSGKDVVARTIHRTSSRRDQPFVNITCSALPANLLESELFGHERGAFTDARQQKLGLFERAAGGTAFLDEISEMDPALQAKILRFLEEKAFRRVGGAVDLRPDVRVVAATNRDLAAEVRAGRFREDLYYRLAVLRIHLPPLRDRPGDVDLLTRLFVETYSGEFHKRITKVSEGAIHLLASHGWPGNVRELRNTVERAVLLADGAILTRRDFQFLGVEATSEAGFELPAAGVDLRTLERSLVTQALQRTGGSRTRAAALLGLNRDQIRYRIGKYALDESDRSADG
jgi:transcriptional regulator with PAS, ATPase and Fis domain